MQSFLSATVWEHNNNDKSIGSSGDRVIG
jgi:hypothetical protein